MLPSDVETVKTLESVGQNRYREFVTERLEARSKSLFEPIRQKKLPLKSKSNETRHAASLMQNVALFSQL